ncbi:hypothetical protein P7K49_026192, partial [Saguinus oedipus]
MAVERILRFSGEEDVDKSTEVQGYPPTCEPPKHREGSIWSERKETLRAGEDASPHV